MVRCLKYVRLACCVLILLLPVALACSAEPAANERVLGVLEDFDALPTGPFQRGFLDSWRWSETVRSQARQSSRLEVVDAAKSGGKLLRVRVDDPQIFTNEALTLLRLAPFYPPEADALRIRLQVITGQAVIYVGGPTAYYGNSDVYTEPQTIRAESEPRWVEVVCNFNRPTWRNFRRSSFSTDAPRNYYNRWAQEPLGLFVAAGTQGEFLIDRIEVLALGEGKPFVKFTPEQVRQVKTIADFEQDSLERTFTLYMANSETEWFEQSWRREKPLRFEPHQLSIADGGLDGRRSLVCTGRSAEEVQCTGIRITGDTQANAFAATVMVDAAGQNNTLVGAGTIAPLDFLVFVAPADKPFPWDRFAASADLRAYQHVGFDYQFSYQAIRTLTNIDFAIYHTRRYLQPGDWTRLVLPAADFTCIYGHGTYRRRLVEHEPLTCDDCIALAWVNPWRRVGRQDVTQTTRIDQLSFVHVPGTPRELRSFWQVDHLQELQYTDETTPRGRVRHVK